MTIKKLTEKQKLFIQEYLVDLNATQAAKRAGYTGDENALGVTGHGLLRNPKIAAAVQIEMDKRADRAKVSADDVLRELVRIATADIAKAYDEKGQLLPIHQIPEDTRRAIASIKVYEEFDGFGKDRFQIGEVREVKFWDKNKSLETLARHLKLLTDKFEHSGKDGKPLVILTMPSNGSEASNDSGSDE